MNLYEKTALVFSMMGFLVGMLPGFICGCAYMQRKMQGWVRG